MFLNKILGFFDLLSILSMILLINGLIPWKIAVMFGVYLMLKGVLFKGDIASMVDFIIGVYLLLIPIFAPKVLTIIFIIYLGQKALVSFF